MDLQAEFAKFFGMPQTLAVIAAAKKHEDEQGPIGDTIQTPGFKGVISRVISWQCVEDRNFAEHHGITIDPEQFKWWVKEYAGLTREDADFWGYFAGKYEGFLSESGAGDGD